jgi:hypothetical protein
VIFAGNFSADACNRTIDCLRQKLGFVSGREFHFSDCSDKIREEFFRCVAGEDFLYHAFVINKQRLYPGTYIFQDGKSFYQFAVSIVCENARSLLQDAKIVIDKNGDRAFKRELELENRMKKQMIDGDGNCLIRKVVMEASHSNNLVQLADMVCGAIARSFNANDHTQRDQFRKLVKRCEKRVQFLPK